jgi:hypothetical protein
MEGQWVHESHSWVDRDCCGPSPCELCDEDVLDNDYSPTAAGIAPCRRASAFRKRSEWQT